MPNKAKALLLLSLIFISSAAVANDDVIGTTYPIAEKSLLEEILNKLKDMESTGELSKKQEEMKQAAIDSINNPRGTKLPRASSNATHYFDPSITVDKDIPLPDGRILHKAGTTVNPLMIKSFTKRMIFIDGNDKKQVDWAVKQYELSGWRDKLILVDGSYMDLMKRLNGKRVYFDQLGGKLGSRETLAKRFGIKAVPSMVYQEGNKLRIDEVKL